MYHEGIERVKVNVYKFVTLVQYKDERSASGPLILEVGQGPESVVHDVVE